eukprot:887020-Pyramimonas_sp.AAC.1
MSATHVKLHNFPWADDPVMTAGVDNAHGGIAPAAEQNWGTEISRINSHDGFGQVVGPGRSQPRTSTRGS